MKSTARSRLASLLVALCLSFQVSADEKPAAEVMLIGLFHFANPGLDSVKSEVIDVMTPENQRYLEALTDRIAAFEPTAVLLEYDRANDERMNERYRAYRAGDYELGVNEIYQLGFRIAHKAGLDRVESFDEREVHWDAGPMMEKLEELPARKLALDDTIAEMSADMGRLHATLSLAELLTHFNQPEVDAENKGIYIATNDIGVGDGFEGARASASWWHRNFRMYAQLQRFAGPGARVVAIAGQGHTAILRDFLRDDPDRVPVALDALF